MINLKIYQLAISLGFLPLCAYAEMCCPLVPGDPIEDYQVSPGYFYPAQFETSGNLDVIVTADFIYWAPHKQLNSYAIEQSVVDTTVQMHVISHNFGYRPGFKVGIGMGLPCLDHFVFNAEYLWFSHTTTSSRTASTGSFITPLPGINQNPPAPQPISSRATSKWHVGIQMAELTAGRPFYLGQRMIFIPSVGAKAIWHHQTQTIGLNLIDGGVGTQRSTFRAWSVGPYLKLDAKGLLCGGLYVLGKIGAVFIYERYTQDDFTTDLPFANPFQRNYFLGSKKPYAFPTLLESGIGLGWGDYFCGTNYHLDLAVSYDYFISMMLITAVFGGNLVKDFYMHGLTVKAQFDF